MSSLYLFLVNVSDVWILKSLFKIILSSDAFIKDAPFLSVFSVWMTPRLPSLLCFPCQNWLTSYAVIQSEAKWRELIHQLIYYKVLMENTRLKCNNFSYISVAYSTNIYCISLCSQLCRRNCWTTQIKSRPFFFSPYSENTWFFRITFDEKIGLVWGSCDSDRPKEQWSLLVHLRTVTLCKSWFCICGRLCFIIPLH